MESFRSHIQDPSQSPRDDGSNIILQENAGEPAMPQSCFMSTQQSVQYQSSGAQTFRCNQQFVHAQAQREDVMA